MERRVRAERGPSARERCGNDWHSPPVFMGRVNQMPIFRDVPEEASNRYGKLLTRLTGHTKTAKNGQNTGFLRLARPSQRRPRTWRWERKRGAALLSFSVCLFRAGILVNSRSDWGCARLRSSAMPFAVGRGAPLAPQRQSGRAGWNAASGRNVGQVRANGAATTGIHLRFSWVALTKCRFSEMYLRSQVIVTESC